MSDYLTNWSLSAGNEREVRDGRNVKIVNVDCGGMTGRKYDEATKIASLVRAAPALLEALEEATETLRHIAKHWPDSFAAHHARAGFKKTCAAIAQAKGDGA